MAEMVQSARLQSGKSGFESRQRLTVLVDMDGVLADFDKHLLKETRHLWPEGYTQADQRVRYATNILPKAAQHEARAVTNRAGFFRELPVMPGAVDGLHALAEQADVWIVTKPLEANPTCRDDKAVWLAEHFGADWVRRLIITPDKSLVDGDILLDDGPHLRWWDSASWVPVVFPWPWNGLGTDWERCYRWQWGDSFDVLLGFAE